MNSIHLAKKVSRTSLKQSVTYHIPQPMQRQTKNFCMFFFLRRCFHFMSKKKNANSEILISVCVSKLAFFVVFVESNKYAVLVFYHHIAQSLPTDAPTNTKRNQCQNIEIVLSQVACFASYFVVFILFIDCDCVRFRLHFI